MSASALFPWNVLASNNTPAAFFINRDGKNHFLEIKNGKNKTLNMIKLPKGLEPHYFTPRPGKENLFGSVESWKPHLVLFDLNKKEIIKQISLEGEKEFFGGHMLYTNDGKKILAALNDGATDKGYLAIYDADSLKEIRRIESGGSTPHDMCFRKNGRELVMISSSLGKDGTVKTESCVTIFDVENLKVKRRLFPGKGIHLGHLKKLNDGKIYMIGGKLIKHEVKKLHQNMTPHMVKLNADNQFDESYIFETRQPCNQQLLSIVHDEKNNYLAITSPDENKVRLYSLKDIKVIQEFEVPEPMSAFFTEDKKNLIIGARIKGLYSIALKVGKVSKIKSEMALGYDSHATILSNYSSI